MCFFCQNTFIDHPDRYPSQLNPQHARYNQAKGSANLLNNEAKGKVQWIVVAERIFVSGDSKFWFNNNHYIDQKEQNITTKTVVQRPVKLVSVSICCKEGCC